MNCSNDNFDDFKDCVSNVIEHHFNEHARCGDWCAAKNKSGDELREARLSYRNKDDHGTLYVQVKRIMDPFLEEENLWEIHHPYDTNIVEGFNKFLTKFLPKDRTYALTTENKAQIYLAILIDSVGYEQGYKIKNCLKTTFRQVSWLIIFRERGAIVPSHCL